MKKSKIKVVISLMVLLVIMITMNKSYAGMADLTDGNVRYTCKRTTYKSTKGRK